MVGNLSSFSENAKRTNVTRSQLALDTKTMGTLQRSNPKVSFLVNLISYFLMMAVILALLTRLGCFEILMDDANLLFCLLDHIRTKELSFTSF
jgi:hypothetical protein